MIITIGELTNEVLPYSRAIEMGMVGCRPFMKVMLGSNTMTKLYLYVLQTAENTYATCNTDDELHGWKFMPTESLHKPFVREKEFIRNWMNDPDEPEKEVEEIDIVMTELTTLDFIEHFYDILMLNRFIQISHKGINTSLTNMGFSNLRVLKTLSCICKGNKNKQPTIRDFIMSIKKGPIVHLELKEKEVKDLLSRFRHFGIQLTIVDNNITDLRFDQYNRERRIINGHDPFGPFDKSGITRATR